MASRLSGALRGHRPIQFLVLFLVVVIGAGLLIGTLAAPGPWYEGLNKPPFNPPDWLFAPVWTLLYVLIAVAGWRTFLRDPGSRVMYIWYAQMALNWIWSPLFFGLHLLWTAFAVILALFYLVLNFIGGTWRKDRSAALMFVPYALWVGFAALLNLSLAFLN
jgi:tryptophan-rich sensory protein